MAGIVGLSPVSKQVKRKPELAALLEDFTHDDVAEVIRFWQRNPVQAAVDIFDFKYGLPPHQTLALRTAWDKADVLQVWSRGSGKTILRSSFILTRKRGMIKVEDILPRNAWNSGKDYWHHFHKAFDIWNGDGWQRVSRILIQPQKRCKTVKTRMGYELTGSDVHLVQGLEDCKVVWRSFNDLKHRDYVLIGRRQEVTWGDDPKDLDECYLIGLLLGDGTVRSSLQFTTADDELRDFVCRYTTSIPYQTKSKAVQIRFSQKFYHYLQDTYGLDSKPSYDKYIPQSILASKVALRACLQGLFDTDGGCESAGVSFCTTSIHMAKQVHLALSLFGIIARLRTKPTKSAFGKAYVIELRGVEADKFNKRIGFRLTRKRDALTQWCAGRKFNTNVDVLPGAADVLVRLKSRHRFPLDGSNAEWRRVRGGIKNRDCLTAESLRYYLDLLPAAAHQDPDYKLLEDLIALNENYYIDTVETITDSVDDCVDFNVPIGERYWANGFINHNTWFLAMFAILSAALLPDEKVGIFGPSFRQSKFVWSELERLYDKSPVIQEMTKKAPIITPDKCHFRLQNGSIVEALPLGSGEKIRGARYFRILGDEAAQIPEDILDTVIGGMRATSKDPMEAVMAMRKQRELLAAGKLAVTDIKEPEKNKLLLASTAFYGFNHLWKRVLLFREEILKEQNANKHPEIVCDTITPTETSVTMWNDDRAILMFDYTDPPEGFMNMRSIEENRLKMSESKWLMEYAHLFVQDSEGFYRRSKIEDARSHHRFTIETRGKSQYNYVLGIDVARNSDNFAIAVGRVVGATVEFVQMLTLNSKSFAEMHDLIRDCVRKWNVVYICMDSGGGGTALQDNLCDPRLCPEDQKLIYDSTKDEDLRMLEGWHILEMIKFSDDSIPQMAEQLRSDLDHNKFFFPALPANVLKGVLDDNGVALEDLETLYNNEIEATIDETTSIIAQATRTGRVHLGLPGEINAALNKGADGLALRVPRKDRWVAIMLMNWAAHQSTRSKIQEKEEIETGFSLGGLLYGSQPAHIARAMMRRH